jgi:hypothetical protein
VVFADVRHPAGTVVVAATEAVRGGALRLTSGGYAPALRMQLNRAVRMIAGFAVVTGLVFGVSPLGPQRSGWVLARWECGALVPEGLLPTLSRPLP